MMRALSAKISTYPYLVDSSRVIYITRISARISAMTRKDVSWIDIGRSRVTTSGVCPTGQSVSGRVKPKNVVTEGTVDNILARSVTPEGNARRPDCLDTWPGGRRGQRGEAL